MSDLVIGRKSVIEFLENSDSAKKLYLQQGPSKGVVQKIIDLAQSKNIEIIYTDKSKLDKLTDNSNHQGVALEAKEYRYFSIDEILDFASKSDRDPLIIILDEITDTHNLGAIIRTAEAAGAHGVVIPKHRSATVNHTVHKTSAGATAFMRVAMVTNINQTIDLLKERGYWIYGADGHTDKEYTEIDYSGSVGLVIGNEGRGISRLTKEKCDDLVKIPMYGRTESLNASTSAAILLYGVLIGRNK